MNRWAVLGAVLLAAACWLPALAGVRRTPALRAPAPAGAAHTGLSRRTAPPDGVVRAVLLRVVDGDTAMLRIGGRRVRARLIGMDAPETWPRHDCFGGEATRALRRLVPPGSPVHAAGDVESHDRYGRRLLYLWTTRGELVEAVLLRGGYARAMAVPPDTRYAGVLHDAEAAAKRARTGLWAACP
jgi:micrococcal nuclease